MRQKINIITLGVANLDRAIEFYEKGLKWKRSEKSQGNIVFFDMKGITFALYPKKDLAEDINIDQQGSGFSGITLALNTKSEKEVDEVLSEVERLGAEIIKAGQKVFWGGYSGYFRDLDGHLFEVAYNPFVSFDENDNLIF